MCLDGIVESQPSDRREAMVAQKQSQLLWIVVKVESGLPAMVEAYQDRDSAEGREDSLRKDMRVENDETGVFEIRV